MEFLEIVVTGFMDAFEAFASMNANDWAELCGHMCFAAIPAAVIILVIVVCVEIFGDF